MEVSSDFETSCCNRLMILVGLMEPDHDVGYDEVLLDYQEDSMSTLTEHLYLIPLVLVDILFHSSVSHILILVLQKSFLQLHTSTCPCDQACNVDHKAFHLGASHRTPVH